MKKTTYIVFVTVVSALVLASCSVNKNTSVSRSYHKTKVKYNILFNGKNAFIKGEEAIHKASIELDDYNDILPIFEISNKEAAKSAESDMDRTIEKCEKSIQLHSIVKKPKKNPNKAKDPKYIAFMAKEEYNPQVQEAWLLRGKALYYKLDFPAAEANFAYVAKHYTDNVDVCTEAKLWSAKGFSEQGWFYEAEDVLGRLSEKSFTNSTNKDYVLVKADLLLRQEQYEAAIPFLENAIKLNKGDTKKRMMFIYAQVLEKIGRIGEAYNAYEAVKKKSTNGIMEFNAVLGMAKCYQGQSMEPIIKEIDKLLKRNSNEQYLDRIYFTLGQLFMRRGNKDKAIENYKLAIEKSTRNGMDKAQALLTLGSIYYDEEKYLEAQPLYAEALDILPMDHSAYKSVQNRSVNLDYVAQYSNTITLQDSLLALANMPQEERIEKVKAVIEEIHKKEEEERKRLEEEARQQEAKDRSAALAASANLSLGETLDKAWYFYNSSLISKGKLEFQKMWGSRPLEDDWRRSNKVSAGFIETDEDDYADDNTDTSTEPIEGEVIAGTDGMVSTGNAELDSYLRTIPTTEALKKASNDEIEEALYNLYYVYENRIINHKFAVDTYNELLRRYPNTEYGQASSSTDTKMEEQIEILYKEAYSALKNGNPLIVKSNLAKAEQCCASSELMPKFYFIDAISGGRAQGKEVFKQKLSTIIEKYPDSEVTPLARDMIALLGQGKEIVSPTSNPISTIHESREAVIVSQAEYAEAIQRAGFEYNPADKHSFVIVIIGTEEQKNATLFAIAQYNFTRFMIKDFDFKVKQLDDGVHAIAVTPLSSLDEAVWYQNSVLSDEGVKESLTNINYKAFVISDDNFVKVFDKESLLKYIDFYQNNNLTIKESDVIKQLEEDTGYVK
ncbi:MAG: tetratricopeptide repeat protein [Paludibacteraceae bacterium]|nr:tetratricopeptide repeat protein [Paludibacteraceae bacterium]